MNAELPLSTEALKTEWNTCPPPQDGTRIVAIGRVLWEDDFSAGSDPFVAEIFWQKSPSDYEGWFHGDLALSSNLDDKVKIDFWMPFPVERQS